MATSINIDQSNIVQWLCNSYTMDCQPVLGDNPQGLASGLSPVQVDNLGINI